MATGNTHLHCTSVHQDDNWPITNRGETEYANAHNVPLVQPTVSTQLNYCCHSHHHFITIIITSDKWGGKCDCPRYLSVCLSVSKITQKRVDGFEWNFACRQVSGHGGTDQLLSPIWIIVWMPKQDNLKSVWNLKSVKKAPHSEQATGHGMHCREILFTPRCSPRAREIPRSVNFFVRRKVAELRGVKVAQFFDFGLFSNAKHLKCMFRWSDYSTVVTSQNGSDFSMWYSKVQRGDCLWLPVGELGSPNVPKFSPMANGYTHTECYCTPHQIWTKDVWKCAILRTDVLSHKIYSPLPPKSHFAGPFNAKPII